LGDDWNDITHPEEIDLLLRQHPVLGQVRDWNVEVTANERGKQQEQCRTGADAKAHISVTQHPELDQHEQCDEQPD
jgi:hypothetical protein